MVGPADLEGQVDSLASLQAGLGAQEGSEGASPEVGLAVDHPEGPKGGYPVVQVVGSYHLGQWEVAPEEGSKSDRHGSLGQNKTQG